MLSKNSIDEIAIRKNKIPNDNFKHFKFINRNNDILQFDINKIFIAIDKAIQSFKSLDEYKKYWNNEYFEYNTIKSKQDILLYFKNLTKKTFYIEDVQNLIIKILKSNDLEQLADHYQKYREYKKYERKSFNKRIIKIIDKYINNATWEIKENANTGYSIQGLNLYVFSKMNEIYWKEQIFKEKLSKYHDSGDFHIHDLYLLSPYCVGWDLKDLLENGFGGVSNKLESTPPKHFDAACGQIVNFLYTLQGESAGAVAFSNVDTYLSPFIIRDNLHKNKIQLLQDMQKFLYNLSVDTRVGFQCLSEDTEILTESGWKLYNQVEFGENIYTFNMKTKEIELMPIIALNIYKYNGTMIGFGNNRSIGQLVTPTHRTISCLVSEDDNSIYTPKLINANDLLINKKPFYSLTAEINDNNEIESFGLEKIDVISSIYDYDGVVWCPTTENETLIARRNGFIFITGNSPFTNFTLDLECPSHMKNEMIIIDGKYDSNHTYGEYQEGIDAFNDAFCEMMMKGDKNHKVFTFPIPTYCIDKDFNWDDPKLKKLWKMTGKYGIPYFANYINNDMNKEDARSMCCRLSLDLSQLRSRGGGLFGSNSLTGSIGVVTINLSRIGYLSKNKEEFIDKLDFLVEKAHEVLRKKTYFIEKMTEIGMYPYSKFYLRNIKKQFGRYWANHFLTIGIVAMHEACLNLFGEGIESEIGYNFALEVMDFLNKKCLYLQEKYGYFTNLEASPFEGGSYKIAQKDRLKYPDMLCFKIEDKPYYTNSTFLPVNTKKNIWEALKHQEQLQSKYTGGTVFHGYLGNRIYDYNVVKNIIKRVLTNYKIPYFNLTPTFSICSKHGYITGEVNKCPKCGKSTLIYSRVVGYLRPVSSWNKGKQQEFKDRSMYDKYIFS